MPQLLAPVHGARVNSDRSGQGVRKSCSTGCSKCRQPRTSATVGPVRRHLPLGHLSHGLLPPAARRGSCGSIFDFRTGDPRRVPTRRHDGHGDARSVASPPRKARADHVLILEHHSCHCPKPAGSLRVVSATPCHRGCILLRSLRFLRPALPRYFCAARSLAMSVPMLAPSVAIPMNALDAARR
jgi:hypothetical protein